MRQDSSTPRIVVDLSYGRWFDGPKKIVSAIRALRGVSRVHVIGRRDGVDGETFVERLRRDADFVRSEYKLPRLAYRLEKAAERLETAKEEDE